jgi:SAM-dependent methyltransferase
MARRVRLRELLVGVEGLALLRSLYDGTDEAADRRLGEVRRVLDGEVFGDGEEIQEAAPRDGYRAWSELYDEPGNPIIALEQPAVWSLFESCAPGRALDAACGTGRHARHLVELGHEVLGVDLTPEMLERAVVNAPGARFVEADLLDIPAGDGEMDLVVCGLALSHVADLRAGVNELARVLALGGRLVISVLHPFQAYLGWHAPFADSRGERRFVREHTHNHADYLGAFRAAGLELRDCVEVELTADQVRAKRRAFRHIPEATVEAYVGLPAVLAWSAGKS